MGLSGNKLSLPWIIDAMRDWKGDKGTEDFIAKLPFLIR